MAVAYAWHNTFQDKKRTLAAVAGISFSVLLIFMQLGFLQLGRNVVTMLYTYFDFDLIIASENYQRLTNASTFDKARLVQAMLVPDIDKMMALNVANGSWVDPPTEQKSATMLVGIEQNPAFIVDEAVKRQLDSLTAMNSVMLDASSRDKYGSLSVGRDAKINNIDVTVTSLFTLGMIFDGDGAVIVNNQTFQNLSRRSSKHVSFGLIQVVSGADPAHVKEQLQAILPSDVLIFERQTIIRREQNYFFTVIPTGIMFQAGVIIAFAIGAVILFQVLATEISNKLHEYATLKAIGFTSIQIYSIGIKQGLLFAVMGYIPALLATNGILYLIHRLTKMQTALTMELALFVLLLTLAMCLFSTFLALQKVRKAAPAELF